MVKVVGGSGILSNGVLELTEFVEKRDLFQGNLH